MRFLFTTQPGIPSAAIRAVDGGMASHVGIVTTGGAVVDSTFLHRGVRMWRRDEWLRKRTLVADVEFALPNEAAAHLWLLDQVGKPYDWTALVGWLLWRDWSEDDSWYCSELAIAAALVGGKTLADRPRRIGPRLAHELAAAWAG